MSVFQRAVKTQAKARIGLYGVGGSGKTMHALGLARVLAGGKGRIALLDCEGGSASKYADLFEFDAQIAKPPFHPQGFATAVRAAHAAGYDVFVADGISPFWSGEGGVLSIVDSAKKRGGGWADGTPAHNVLVDALLNTPIHIIVTIRAKSDSVKEVDDRGKVSFRKVGVKIDQRDTIDYELDVLLYLDLDNSATVEKSRWPGQLGAQISMNRVPEWAVGFKDWLESGAVPAEAPPAPAPVAAAPPPAAAPPAPAPVDPTGGLAPAAPETAAQAPAAAPPAAPAEALAISEARVAIRERVKAGLAALKEVDAGTDYGALVKTKIPEWFPGNEKEGTLDDAQADELASRIEATLELVRTRAAGAAS